MKVRIAPKLLADAIGWAARALPARPVVPVLGGILVTASDTADQVTVSAFDYDTSATVTIPADTVTEPGKVLLPGQVLVNAVKKLPARDFVQIAAAEQEAMFEAGRAGFTLPLLPVGDYPALPQPPAAVGTIDAADLKEAVSQVVAATAGAKPGKPMYAVIRLDGGGDMVTLAGTDSYRIAARTIGWTATDGTVTAHIPARTLNDLAKALPDGPVTIGLDNNLVSLTIGAQTATVRLFGVDEYVNYQPRITANYPTWAIFDKNTLKEAVERVALFATNPGDALILDFEDGTVHIQAGGDDHGKGADTVDVALNGNTDPIRFRFQPQFLTDAINAIHTDQVRLGLRANNRPVLVTSDDEQQTFRHLVMPLRPE
jgi:DNA polymerase-3 subunit beta